MKKPLAERVQIAKRKRERETQRFHSERYNAESCRRLEQAIIHHIELEAAYRKQRLG
ncbi:MAG: hypothetical protein AB7P18_05585 [Candidatus Binatia bacterium]